MFKRLDKCNKDQFFLLMPKSVEKSRITILLWAGFALGMVFEMFTISVYYQVPAYVFFAAYPFPRLIHKPIAGRFPYPNRSCLKKQLKTTCEQLKPLPKVSTAYCALSIFVPPNNIRRLSNHNSALAL
jgi:hypothetical protein